MRRTLLALVSFVLLFSAPYSWGCAGGVTALTLAELCARAEDRTWKTACLDTGKNWDLDQCGLGICNQFTTIGAITECIGSTRGMKYSDADITACNQFRTVKEVTHCLRTRGTPSPLALKYKTAERFGKEDGTSHANALPVDHAEKAGQEAGELKASIKAELDAKDRDFYAGYSQGRANPKSNEAAASSYDEGRAKGKQAAESKAIAWDRPVAFRAALQRGFEENLERTATIDLSKTPELVAAELPRPLPASPDAYDPKKDIYSLVTKPVKEKTPAVSGPAEPALGHPSAKNEPKTNVPEFPKDKMRPPCEEGETECLKRYKQSLAKAFTSRYTDRWNGLFIPAFNASSIQSYGRGLMETRADKIQEGLALGNQHQGLLDGYEAYLAASEEDQTFLGTRDFELAKRERHLVRLRALELVGGKVDLVMPGSEMQFALVLDNLGEVESPESVFSVIIREIRNPKTELFLGTQRIPRIPGRTRLRVLTPFRYKVRVPQPGANLAFRAEFETPSERAKEFPQSVTLNSVPHYPIEVSNLKFEKPLTVDTWGGATLVLVNPTKSRSVPYNLTLKISPATAELEQTEIAIPALEPGEVFNAALNLRPSVWVEETKTSFQATLSEAEGQEVSKQNFAVLIPTDRSAGLQIAGTQQGLAKLRVPVDAGSTTLTLHLVDRRSDPKRGGLRIVYTGCDNPAIRLAGTTFNSVGMPGTSPDFTSIITATKAADGQVGTASFALYEGDKIIQRVAVYIQAGK